MVENHRICQLINWIRGKPFISTTLAAIMLAGFWIACWLLVFLMALFLLKESSTSIYGLFIGMWLSTSVEALIRCFEHASFSTIFSRPQLNIDTGDEKDYPVSTAIIFFLIGIVVTFFIGFSVSNNWLVVPDLYFEGVPIGGEPLEYLQKWKVVLTNDITQSVILVCFALRFFIYKRNHKMIDASSIKPLLKPSEKLQTNKEK